MRNKNKLFNHRNPNWKGINVGYVALHDWIKRRKYKPLLCQDCREKKKLDLANISGKYLRDVNDFEWLCRKCHMEKDGRLKEFIKVDKISKCTICKNSFNSRIDNAKYCSERCKSHAHYYSYNKEYMKSYAKKNRDRINELSRLSYHRRKNRSFLE